MRWVQAFALAMGLVGLLCAMALSGCMSSTPVPRTKALPNGCTGQVWAVKVDGAGCPALDGGWKAEQVCAGVRIAGSSATEPQSLCSYSWIRPTVPTAEQIAELKSELDTKAPGAQIEEDCANMTAQIDTPADALGSALKKAMAKRFRAAAEADFSFMPGTPTPTPVKTRVVVADTWPGKSSARPEPHDSVFVRGRDEHGYLVATLVSELSSPEGEPWAEVVPVLALPNITTDEIDLQNGGYFGRQIHFAKAVCDAVDDWDTERAQGRASPHLVITAALGSEPSETNSCVPDAKGNLPLPMQAVRMALEHASCYGAATIVAAGNSPGGDASTGGAACSDAVGSSSPTCPAAMAKFPAPDRAQCIAMHSASTYDPEIYGVYDVKYTHGPLDPAIGNPLVYPVGATDLTGKEIKNARKSGLPPLWAPGALATTENENGTQALATGTSLATAVLAANAAVVWAVRPELSAAEVMSLIYKAGRVVMDEQTSTPRMATFWSDDKAPPPEVRNASIRASLKAALPEAMFATEPTQPPSFPYVEGSLSIVVDGKTRTLGELFNESIQQADAAGVRFDPEHVDHAPSELACSGQQGATTGPEPASNPCETRCGFFVAQGTAAVPQRQGTAFLSFGKGLPYSMSNVTLVLYERNEETGQTQVRKESFPLAKRYDSPPGATFAIGPLNEIYLERLESVWIEGIATIGGEKRSVVGQLPVIYGK